VPLTISQYVLKVHSRCDLACDHCYVYEHADQSWRGKPRAMSSAIVDAAARRIAEHAVRHQLGRVRVVLHGGEPLLIGHAGMAEILAALDRRIAPVTKLYVSIQTNGVLLDERWCDLFGQHGVMIGVSLDGDRAANDRHRRFADGRSSYEFVSRSLALLREPRYRHLYAGILCTIDIGNDPIAVYEALIAQDPPRLDLLLPHATWENPPARPAGLSDPYAAWLLAVYRRWARDGRPVPIRYFDSLISVATGGPSWTAAVGTDPVDLMVIETDGSFEEPDSLKIAYDGASATSLHVSSHTVDDVAKLPGFAVRGGGVAALSRTCQACEVVQVCGGGLYAHRYRAQTGFDNPSVYCADLKSLITQLSPEVRQVAPAASVPATRVTPRVTAVAAPSGAPRPAHVLPPGAFDALAAGPGSVAAIDSLAQMRLSITRALVAAVATSSAAEGRWRNEDLRRAAAEGWALLCELDAKHPSAVREVLSHPFTRVWAVRCLSPSSTADAELGRAHLAGLAAAAAWHAEMAASLRVPVQDGAVYLPTVGALRVEVGSPATTTVTLARRQVTAVGREGTCARSRDEAWHATRRTSSGILRVALEDLDPFRDCHGWPVTGRLTADESRAWKLRFVAAGRRLAATVPAYADVLAAGLISVVPLREAAARDRSAAARHAFGAIALALPLAAATLDDLIIHEFQHVKLHALIDLHELFDAADPRRVRVPWRTDARPVEGVLHGAYAHLALAHLWRAKGKVGHDRYLRYRAWVSEAATALLDIGALTADGERFVDGIRAAAHADA
jgi:uncharacterized protein